MALVDVPEETRPGESVREREGGHPRRHHGIAPSQRASWAASQSVTDRQLHIPIKYLRFAGLFCSPVT